MFLEACPLLAFPWFEWHSPSWSHHFSALAHFHRNHQGFKSRVCQVFSVFKFKDSYICLPSLWSLRFVITGQCSAQLSTRHLDENIVACEGSISDKLQIYLSLFLMSFIVLILLVKRETQVFFISLLMTRVTSTRFLGLYLTFRYKGLFCRPAIMWCQHGSNMWLR